MNFLLANWKLAGIALVILTIGGYLGITKYQLSNCKNANLELQLAIQQQNNSIKQLADKGLEASQRAAKELELAKKGAARHEEKTRSITSLQTSKDECTALKELIKEQRK